MDLFFEGPMVPAPCGTRDERLVRGRESCCSVPAVSQKLHHAQFLLPLPGQGQALFALPLVYVLGELIDVCFSELRAGLKIGRDSQDG